MKPLNYNNAESNATASKLKPLNYDNSPCNPTSSNCVIWQGPDLDCIKLCKGDSISDVIANLATELCIVMDELSITNYDLSCFDLVGCKPETFKELLQFLIDQICLLLGIPKTPESKKEDLLVDVAPCFVVGGITRMLLTDYVIAIGLRICNILDQISVINLTLSDHEIRITILENAPPPTFTIPPVASDCILQMIPDQIGGVGSPALPVDQILNALINDDTYGYCALVDATGLPADLNSAVLTQCIANTDLQLYPSVPGATYSASANWNSNWLTDSSAAASIRNIWVVLCDIYNYLSNIPGVTITETECSANIANDADIYAYIDISSGPYSCPSPDPGGQCAIADQNKFVLVSAISQWRLDYIAANPLFTGGLYVFQTQTEQYLSMPRRIKLGSSTGLVTFNWVNQSTGLVDPTAGPAGWNTAGWVAPTSLIFIAFVNEAGGPIVPGSPRYHGAQLPPNLIAPTTTIQPTPQWDTDWLAFDSDKTSYWITFNACVYAAYVAAQPDCPNFLLHAYAAIKGIEIQIGGLSAALGGNYDPLVYNPAGNPLAVGPGSNPYMSPDKTIGGARGWTAVLDKSVDPITGLINFTAQEFTDDLNEQFFGSGTCNSESIIQSWNSTTQSLVLRQITSCSLDLSVTNDGCLSIEATSGTSIDTYDTNTVNLTLNSANFLSAEVQDTNWHNLEGFDFYSTNPALLTKRPMARRIGNVIHFRGTVTIPLDSFTVPGTVVIYDYYSGVNTYEGVTSGPAHSKTPYTGVGGMNYLSGGSIQFNKGASVIPTTVLPAGYVIDSTYSLGWRMAWRSMITGTCSGLLTTMCNLAMGPGGQLTWGVLADLEESFVVGCNPGAWSTSAMNYVISNVTQGNHVTDFKSALNVHDSTLTGNQPTVSFSFTDPNTIPFTFTYLNTSGPDFKAAETYPITINANDQTDIGGFQTILDGLMVYICPCGALLPTPTPCAIPNPCP